MWCGKSAGEAKKVCREEEHQCETGMRDHWRFAQESDTNSSLQWWLQSQYECCRYSRPYAQLWWYWAHLHCAKVSYTLLGIWYHGPKCPFLSTMLYLRVLPPSHMVFRFQFSWMLILTLSGPISTTQTLRSTRAKSSQTNVQEVTSSPLDQSCECGHHPVHLEEGSEWDVGMAAGSRVTVLQRKPNLHQQPAWFAPNVTGHSGLMMKGIVLLSSISNDDVRLVVV